MASQADGVALVKFKKQKRISKHHRRSRPWRTPLLHLGKKGSDGKSRGERSDVPKGLAPKLRIKRTDCNFQLPIMLVYLPAFGNWESSYSILIDGK